MPRAGQVKPPVVERLSDRIAIGVLTSTYPPALVDQVVAEAGRREERQRLLPARVVVWLVLAMALFSGQAYEEVARLLAGGLGWAGRHTAAASRPPSPRCACWRWPSAAPTRSSRRPLARSPAGRSPWRPRSSASSARRCCCWPTAALPALGCGGRRPRPARRWSGG